MLRNFLRRFDQGRRRHTAGISAWLYRLIGRDRVLLNKPLAADQISRIMVVRNNKRIGNMYFLLPFLHRLRDVYPKASIDLMVISDSQAAIFDGMPLARIWVSNFAFDSIWQFLGTMRECRKEPYDLLLMPHPSSTDILIGGYLHARNKVSFASSRVSPVYPHSIEAPHASAHAALTPLALVETLVCDHPPTNHLMALSEQECENAKNEVQALRGNASYCVAYFRGARGKKIIADSDWLKIREQFDNTDRGSIVWVEILSPDITTPLQPDTLSWQSKDLRKLGAFLAACDLFICGDTGPLHLADAAGARCLGLFTATSPEHYGCMGRDCINLTDLSALETNRILRSIRDVQKSTND